MALWQVGFFVLPKKSLNSNCQFRLSEEHSFDDSCFWKPEKIRPSFFDPIDKILPQTKSWASYLILYGDENSNRFEVVFEDDVVESVSFRVDFTSNYDAFLSELIEFFILNGLVVLDENLNIVPLNFEFMKRRIESSPQVEKYRRLSNP